MSKASTIEIVSVTKVYGTTTAVRNISLKIPGGSYCCFLGPSGCGKTTTLRMIAGHEVVTSGDIGLGNTVITDLPPARRGTAMMFQSYALFPHLDLVDNVAFSLKMKGVAKEERRARALEMLKVVHMDAYASRRPAQLSGGQQQRVAIARAMAGEPSILLADEPTGALDTRTGREVFGIMQKLHEAGHTIVLITHDPSIADQAESVVRISDGVLTEERRGKHVVRPGLEDGVERHARQQA